MVTRIQKRLARRLATQAISKGILVRPNNCTECKKATKVHAHHNNYTKPLEVTWFCSKCHWKWHKINGFSSVRNTPKDIYRYVLSINSIIHSKIKAVAMREKRSLTKQVQFMLAEFLEKGK